MITVVLTIFVDSLLKPKETYNTTNSLYRSRNNKPNKPHVRPREFTGFIPPDRSSRTQSNHFYDSRNHERRRERSHTQMIHRSNVGHKSRQESRSVDNIGFNTLDVFPQHSPPKRRTAPNHFSEIPTFKPVGK